MRITDKTKFSTFAPVEKYLTANGVEELKQAAERQFGAMYDLTFAQFHACANGDFNDVLGEMKDPTVLQVYWMKRFSDFIGEFANGLKRLTIKQTEDEKKASSGMLKVAWDEGLLVFIQSFFGLKSFKEAEQITVGEILIAKRASYNQDIFMRNMNKIQMNKIGKKK